MAKPTIPVWNSAATNRTTPSAGEQSTGWIVGVKPVSSATMNWLQGLTYEWINWLDARMAEGADNNTALKNTGTDNIAIQVRDSGGVELALEGGEGVCIGYSGTAPTAGLAIADDAFNLQVIGGTPYIVFSDTNGNSYIQFDRTNDLFKFITATASGAEEVLRVGPGNAGGDRGVRAYHSFVCDANTSDPTSPSEGAMWTNHGRLKVYDGSAGHGVVHDYTAGYSGVTLSTTSTSTASTGTELVDLDALTTYKVGNKVVIRGEIDTNYTSLGISGNWQLGISLYDGTNTIALAHSGLAISVDAPRAYFTIEALINSLTADTDAIIKIDETDIGVATLQEVDTLVAQTFDWTSGTISARMYLAGGTEASKLLAAQFLSVEISG